MGNTQSETNEKTIQIEDPKTGRVVTFKVKYNHKVGKLLEITAEFLGYQSSQDRSFALVYKGQELKDEFTINDLILKYGLKNEDTLTLWARVVGGGEIQSEGIKYTFQLSGVEPNIGKKQIEIDPRQSLTQIISKVRAEFNLNPILDIRLIANGKIVTNLKSVKSKSNIITVLAFQKGGMSLINQDDLEIAVIQGLLIELKNPNTLEQEICQDNGISLQDFRNYLQQVYYDQNLESVLIDVFKPIFNEFKENAINQREALLRVEDYILHRLGFRLGINSMSESQKNDLLNTLSRKTLGKRYYKVILDEYRSQSLITSSDRAAAYRKIKDLKDFNGDPLFGGDTNKMRKFVKEKLIDIVDFFKVVDVKGRRLTKYDTLLITTGSQYYQHAIHSYYTDHLQPQMNNQEVGHNLEHVFYRHYDTGEGDFKTIGITDKKMIVPLISEIVGTKQGVSFPDYQQGYPHRIFYKIEYQGDYYYLGVMPYHGIYAPHKSLQTALIVDELKLLKDLKNLDQNLFVIFNI
ncbi:MAG: hypothetical protein BAJALOKI1v1_590017 [Promethearchaeota archaeon]|nr:MAG: hypothetical protein BAJALOKI1v1_590017 [Candidatus Lokiarchaeota archaeon]